MVQPVQHGDGHKPTTHRLGLSQRGIRIRYAVESLMNAAVVVQADKPKPILPKREKSAIRGIRAAARLC